MYEPNIPYQPTIPDLVALLQQTLEQVEAVPLSQEDRALIELKRHIVLAISELSISQQHQYPGSLPGIVPFTKSAQEHGG